VTDERQVPEPCGIIEVESVAGATHDRQSMPEIVYAKPDPDLFIAAAERLDTQIGSTVVIGDSIWDMLAARRCHALGVTRILPHGDPSPEQQNCGFPFL
jgi:phosphoglycolate phosphatase-like HAD superfamily hydrolase